MMRSGLASVPFAGRRFSGSAEVKTPACGRSVGYHVFATTLGERRQYLIQQLRELRAIGSGITES
jgi:hypothetical protein